MRPRIALRLVLILAALAPACASRSSPSGSRPIQEIPPSPGWTEQGIASWYGGRDGFEGKPTASGEIYDSSLLTAAHRELPLGSVVDVTNLDNGKTVRVRINDRGPFVFGRVIDLSRAAAREIGLIGPGVGSVRLTVVTPGAPMEIVSTTGRWAIQVGSFADHLRAERHAERVRGTGRAVFLEPYRGLSRVKVGPFDGRRDAERELASLEDEGFEGIVVPTD
ncbi:MAG: septal ring lytic transglycosylase RlpA family lipoprotein [Acidobacteria bacterium]|nr:MAG: septal ring lytic transglycosylase RlpA family lipoprotein [Acidobacteriota bacterium]